MYVGNLVRIPLTIDSYPLSSLFRNLANLSAGVEIWRQKFLKKICASSRSLWTLQIPTPWMRLTLASLTPHRRAEAIKAKAMSRSPTITSPSPTPSHTADRSGSLSHSSLDPKHKRRIMQPSSATVLLSKPLYHKSPTKRLRSKRNETTKWTPAKYDPDRVDDWYHVDDLVMRWYIDQSRACPNW